MPVRSNPMPNDRDTLLVLAQRCEAADASEQRELLIEAFLAALGPAKTMRRVTGSWAWHPKWFAFTKMLDAEAYESAAMTLLPEAEGVGWRMTDGAGGPTAEVWCFDYDTGRELYHVGANPTATPALALVAASLRARAEGGVDG
jgi:hypothetical protein